MDQDVLLFACGVTTDKDSFLQAVSSYHSFSGHLGSAIWFWDVVHPDRQSENDCNEFLVDIKMDRRINFVPSRHYRMNVDEDFQPGQYEELISRIQSAMTDERNRHIVHQPATCNFSIQSRGELYVALKVMNEIRKYQAVSVSYLSVDFYGHHSDRRVAAFFRNDQEMQELLDTVEIDKEIRNIYFDIHDALVTRHDAKMLRLDGSRFMAHIGGVISNLTSLRHVSLYNLNMNLEASVLALTGLSRCRELQWLSLSGNVLTGILWLLFSNTDTERPLFPRLMDLNLIDTLLNKENISCLTDAIRSKQMPVLETLHMEENNEMAEFRLLHDCCNACGVKLGFRKDYALLNLSGSDRRGQVKYWLAGTHRSLRALLLNKANLGKEDIAFLTKALNVKSERLRRLALLRLEGNDLRGMEAEVEQLVDCCVARHLVKDMRLSLKNTLLPREFCARMKSQCAWNSMIICVKNDRAAESLQTEILDFGNFNLRGLVKDLLPEKHPTACVLFMQHANLSKEDIIALAEALETPDRFPELRQLSLDSNDLRGMEVEVEELIHRCAVRSNTWERMTLGLQNTWLSQSFCIRMDFSYGWSADLSLPMTDKEDTERLWLKKEKSRTRHESANWRRN